MTEQQKPTGHVGNLTKEEEEKLQELWTALFKVCGVVASEKPENDQKQEQQNGNGEGATPSDTSTPDAKKPKKRLGFFSRKSESPSDSPSSDSVASSVAGMKLSDADDKYGETREFLEALKDTSPEDIRLAFWSMVKHDHPDALLLRFLRARKYDVNRALVMLVSAFRWRSQTMHLDDIMVKGDCFMEEESKSEDLAKKQEASDFAKLLQLGESFIHSTDKAGRPICYIRVRLHRIGAHCESSLERYTVYLIETSRLLLKSPVETAALVFDMTDFSLANMDYTPIKFMIKCFEANYPESLGIILVHKAPWIFSSIWAVIKGWLDPVVAAKVHFTKTPEDLEAVIPRNNLLKSLGGDDEYDYKYVEPIEGENDKQWDTSRRDELFKTRMEIAGAFQEATLAWIASKSDPTAKEEEKSSVKKTRTELAEKYCENYWQLDPYIRARSMYDRLGLIPPSKEDEAKELSPTPQLSEKVNGDAVPVAAEQIAPAV
ncbi:phosphatidylinositol transfer protein CSR1 [Nannizzia gypsea CBS 118893]|uniref:Phosphatidylinositol transfer protein CSR1 n=1 Tax=Arthroderma gypseum (strain ATCC MYA-4604 / CBS 118893) TaxID=535722 RepID=E5QZ95_ARTGP|nr:phosphatidylinositol transfer protein CSR1 [Nannizzia gypsea CBS 118893]EFQ97327.1 phosphatidylinositol transfer protein CSR1 [Nannizzia gypsea CBS 118893]